MLKRDYNQIDLNMKEFNPNKTILVLKDNAYGFGLKEVLSIAKKNGFKYYAVKSIMEAKYVKKEIPNSYIIILGHEYSLNKGYYYLVSNKEEYEICKKKKLNFHYKLNIKMNRLGFNFLDLNIINDQLCKGIFTHSPNVDKKNNSLLLEEFLNKIKCINKEILYHIGGSSYLNWEASYFVRTGFSLYQNAISLEGKIIGIRKIKKGEYVGYQNTYQALCDEIIGICNIGYASGLSRINKEKEVYINNRPYHLIGIKCMDYSFIRIDESIHLYDDVEFFGKNISAEEFGKKVDKTLYELYLHLK